MSDLSPREHALRVAVLEAVAEMAKTAYEKARTEAGQVFAAVRADGSKTQAVLLPDGGEIGSVAIKAGVTTVEVDERGLLAWVRAHSPDDIEPYITSEAVSDAEIVDMVRSCFPGAVNERVRQSARGALVAQMTETGGFVTDTGSGETELLGTVENHKPTGAFAFTGGTGAAKARRDRIVSEWQRGQLREIALGVLALPSGGEPGE